MDFPNIKSAGIQPYAVNGKGEITFLLGKEGFAPGWTESDKWGLFGGKVESGESVHEGAARECYEETAGCVLSLAELRQKLDYGDFRLAIDVIFKKTRFVCFFIQVPCRDYPSMFRHTKHFVQYVNGSVECIEKSQVKWFSHEELRAEIHPHCKTPTITQAPPRNTANQFKSTSRYGRKPIFRRKYAEMMRYFFDVNGGAFLIGGRNRPRYLYFRVHPKNSNHHGGGSGGGGGGSATSSHAAAAAPSVLMQ